jgi:hypothetical protein
MTRKAERDYMQRVADLGCLICSSPAQLHHPREGQGKAQRAQNWLVVPLCQEHHTGPAGIHNRQTFYTRHRLDEWDLLAMTIARLNGAR